MKRSGSRRRARIEREALSLDGDRLRLVVVADTHSEPHPGAAALIARQEPDRILHAGDIGALSVLDDLARIAPVIAVRGNIDVHAPEVPEARVIDVQDGDRSIVRLLLVHIAVYGPRLRADIVRLARAEGATMVVCGHSHVPFIGEDHRLVMFNPGSIGPRRFSLPILFGVIDVTRERVSLAHIDCETGEPWLPPARTASG